MGDLGGAVARDGLREMAVLVPVLRAWSTGGATAPAPDLVGGNVEWARVTDAAERHGVLPLLYRGLRTMGRGAVPAATLEGLGAKWRDHAQRALFLTGELLDILRAFESGSLRAMPLKGPIWASTLYRDVALRQYADLDVLVAPRDAARAREMLVARGYRIDVEQDTAVTAVRDASRCRVAVDLQWSVAPAHFSFPMDDQLWARAVRVGIGGTTVWQPAAVDQLILLCGHPAKHSWSRLGWVCDIAAFLKTQGTEVDWEHALDRARRLGGERLLFLGLRLAVDLLHATVPPQVLACVDADRRVASLGREIRGRLCGRRIEPSAIHGSYGSAEAALLYISERERLRDKWAYAAYLCAVLLKCCSFAPNKLDRAAVRLPRSVGFLYYVVRPIRLARKYGPIIVTHARRATLCWR
jgi:hypothetical protein